MSQRYYTLQMQQFTMNDCSTVLTQPAGGDLAGGHVLLEDKRELCDSPHWKKNCRELLGARQQG
jgi:hypothetical protein